jgi:hypothetical protein
MIKKFGLWAAAAAFIVLQSCSVNTETTYFKDSATSMESSILMDQGMMGMINMMNSSGNSKTLPDLANLSSDWQSLYDMQKDGKVVLNEKEAGPLKKMYVKVNRQKGEILGLSLKYDKLLPVEIASLFASKKELKSIPLQDIARWDGEKLVIDTEKFNMAESLYELQKVKPEAHSKSPRTKQDSIEAYGRQMASGVIGMAKMFNGNFTNTLKFQRPIKRIEGKHDFVEQVDDRTIKINVKSADIWDEGKNLKNKDKKITIYTK